MGYSPWDCKELDMTEQLTHTHIPAILTESNVELGKPKVYI